MTLAIAKLPGKVFFILGIGNSLFEIVNISDIRNIKTLIVKFVGSHCPQTNLEQNQNLTIGLDTTAPNIYQVHWRKTDAIYKPNYKCKHFL